MTKNPTKITAHTIEYCKELERAIIKKINVPASKHPYQIGIQIPHVNKVSNNR